MVATYIIEMKLNETGDAFISNPDVQRACFNRSQQELNSTFGVGVRIIEEWYYDNLTKTLYYRIFDTKIEAHALSFKGTLTGIGAIVLGIIVFAVSIVAGIIFANPWIVAGGIIGGVYLIDQGLQYMKFDAAEDHQIALDEERKKVVADCQLPENQNTEICKKVARVLDSIDKAKQAVSDAYENASKSSLGGLFDDVKNIIYVVVIGAVAIAVIPLISDALSQRKSKAK